MNPTTSPLPSISQPRPAAPEHASPSTQMSTIHTLGENMDSKKVDIHSLMSPPEIALDSFRQGVVGRHVNSTKMHLPTTQHDEKRIFVQHRLPMSPPVSPYSRPISSSHGLTTPLGQSAKDPVLYPGEEGSPASPPGLPLFAVAEYEDHKRIVDNHLRARSVSIFSGMSPPRREEYELALLFRSQVMRHYVANPKAWLQKERALLKADRRAGAQRYHAIMPAKPIAAKPSRIHRTADRVSKPQSAPRSIRTSIDATPAMVSRPTALPSATPEPSRRIVAPNREDKDFHLQPDFCPPVNSLPSRPNSLKVDWKGQPIDLNSDPHASLLHPDEVLLAGNLRLDCATYLTSKRRIFDRRLQCLRTGKEFRKTDAQQACKIDVNKASKLWTAFDKVNWLDAHWVRRFL